ncbi:hypothetical protein [Burkholderia sp. ISTR5]|uniref:hypothetical protein n=1 Tax=Burkholderia sp. ISTR5 TaxID=2500161 RepID=UPI00136F7FE6|nr:hypothetical protein [Burkholderia sp. ISTR5]NBI50102.1 hypothetical protein [Burkholderia sp. ISTR5]
MDQRQIEEAIARSHALTMQLTEMTARQLEESIRIAERPWWIPFAMGVTFTVAAMGCGAALAYLIR